MKKNGIILLVLLTLSLSVYAQELYTPRDIRQAYENGTRGTDGKPGPNYWQNTADYSIRVMVNPPERNIQGSEEIHYFNNSPDTLTGLNFKLILNNHKPGAARLGQTSDDYLTSGTHIDSYSENGEKQPWEEHNDGTNKYIRLATPLAPGGDVTLNIDWHYNVSVQSGREGAIDSTTFYLAYFYPRVAVYDDYEGWDFMTFTGSQEFYNDFNNYSFEVTVPKNYLVWATGDLLNPDEVLEKKYARLLEKSMTSDDVIPIAHQKDLKSMKVTAGNKTNTWKWKAENVSDIAIAISDHYNWDAGSVVVDSVSGRRASVQAAYDEPSEDFQKMVEYGKHALSWFSTHLPGVPYPYQKSTIVRGFADMEYPMMVNDNSQDNPDFTRFVVEHEIAHTYFPFYMGVNETRFGFMDEGWATALEHVIGIDDLGKERAVSAFQNFRVRRWITSPSMDGDVPIIVPAHLLSGSALGNNEYGKAALGYLAMRDLLGEKQFKSTLQGYMDRWHGKHPVPWDFFYSFNDITGKDLNWFWKRWYFSPTYIDLSIANVDAAKGSMTLKNIGGMPAPVDVVITLADGTQQTKHLTPEIWKDHMDQTTVDLGVTGFTSLQLDGGIFMDANPDDNSWK